MSKTLKIFFIVLGLGIFVLPKQVVFAKNKVECCDQKSTKEECCKTKKSTSCHTKNSTKNSKDDNCGDDCTNCHSCTVHFATNFLSSELNFDCNHHVFILKLNFDYGISYIFSSTQNIWQPPKIS